MAKRKSLGEHSTKRESLVAAAQRIDLTREIYGSKRLQQDWQKVAWQMMDEIGEVGFAANFMGDAFAQMRIYVATKVGKDIIELDADGKDLPEGINANDVKLAWDALDALNYPNGLTELQRIGGIGFFQVGETWLIGRVTDEGEEWDINSTSQVEIKDGKYVVKRDENDRNPVVLQEGDYPLRIWRKHAQYPEKAYSLVRSALTILEELLLLTLEVRAVTQSRISSGILAIPDTMNLTRVDTEDEDGEPVSSGFSDDLMRHLIAPIKEPGSAAAVVPFLIEGDKEDIEAIRHITFGRELSREAREQRLELIGRYAATINLPNEIVTGKASLNHWSAWQVDEDTINQHVAPFGDAFVNALTIGYLHPRLEIENPETIIFAADYSGLINKGDQSKVVFEAHDKELISDEASRNRLGISEEEAPTPEEIADRVERKRTKAPVKKDDEEKQPPENSRTAAADEELFNIAELERDLRVRLQVAADAAMNRALERAGAKLRSLSLRDKEAKAMIADADVNNVMLAAEFPALLAAVNQTPEELVSDAFEAYGEQWDKKTAEAQDLILELAALGLSKTDIEQARQEFKLNREAGKAELISALTVLAAALLFSPKPSAPPQGEFEKDVLVPSGVIRNSLARAGGSPVVIETGLAGIGTDGIPVGGIFSSSIARDLYSKATNLYWENEYRWVYGDQLSRKVGPFLPHLRLNGKKFNSWSDPKLKSSGGFPNTLFYYPGDHRYCGCDYDFTVKIRR